MKYPNRVVKEGETNASVVSVGLPPGNYWCATFVYWCFDQACTKLQRRNPLTRTGQVMTHWNKTTGKKILVSDAVNRPSLVRPGQIFMMNTGGSSGHTGLVEKVEGGFIQTIEGNTNDNGSSEGIGVFRLQRKILKN